MTSARLVGDVRVLPRNSLVDIAASLGERDVIRPNEPVAVVSDLSPPANVDAGGDQRVRPSFHDAM
jgi:hypothetical protein